MITGVQGIDDSEVVEMLAAPWDDVYEGRGMTTDWMVQYIQLYAPDAALIVAGDEQAAVYCAAGGRP